jgi:hypothetical protein
MKIEFGYNGVLRPVIWRSTLHATSNLSFLFDFSLSIAPLDRCGDARDPQRGGRRSDERGRSALLYYSVQLSTFVVEAMGDLSKLPEIVVLVVGGPSRVVVCSAFSRAISTY